MMKWIDKEFSDIWGFTIWSALQLLIVFGIIAIILYSVSTKTFNGYYMKTAEGKHRIYINWENAPDETAFYTYNSEEAMRVFKELKELEK